MQQIGSMFFVQVALFCIKEDTFPIPYLSTGDYVFVYLDLIVNMVREHVKGVGENFTQ